MDGEREQRERESREEPGTKYEQLRDEEEAERETLADEVDEPPPSRDDR